MMQSFLLIGVGGSGGQTLRFLHRELSRRLRESPWKGGIPDGWQFLHIDVPEDADGYDPGVPRVLDRAPGYVGLAEYPNDYEIYDGRLSGASDVLPALVGWRPDPARVEIPIWQGAGQRRAVGRVVTLSELAVIRQNVNAAIGRMGTDGAKKQLQDLSRIMGSTDEPETPSQAIVITSLGGGAGSGAFLDVVEMLLGQGRSTPWLERSITVSYTSEIFADEGNRPGVQPNSLAAFSEFLSAYEHEGELSNEEGVLFKLGGSSGRPAGRRAMKYNMIVGRSNGGSVNYIGSTQVYEAVGKTLASFVANPTIQSKFNSYLKGNWSGPQADFGLVKTTELRENPCSSFGYANVGLGFRLFGSYSAQRLARAAVGRLLRGHDRHRQADDRRPEEVLIDERAEMMSTWFFGEAHLHELDDGGDGGEHDDVLNAFRDRAVLKEMVEQIGANVTDELRRNRNKLKPADWAGVLSERVELERRQLSSSLAQLRIERAREWTEGIERSLLNAVVTAAANEGIPVTTRLLVKLDEQLQLASEDLRSQAASLEQKAGKAIASIKGLFAALGEKLLTSNNDTFAQAIRNGTAGIAGREEATSRRFAAAFIDDLRVNVLPGLRAALESAHMNLKRAVDEGEIADEVAAWPTDQAVPPRLQPAPNELLLTDIMDFPKLFDDRLVDVFGGAPGTAASSALREIITGCWPSDTGAVRDNQDLITPHDSWQCVDNEVRAADQAPQAASFVINLTPRTILQRADTWVEERQGAFSQMHFGTLADHLDPQHPQATARADAFVDAMSRAMQASRPLVRVDTRTLAQVHGNHRIGYAIAMDPLPVSKNHPARARLEALLLEAGVVERPNQLDKCFSPGSRRGDVEIATFFDQSLHPLVFGSLVGPIADEWGRRKVQPRDRLQFWEFRRARPLTSFVPVSPEHQRLIAVGWLVGRALGYVVDGDPVTVWTEAHGQVAFPSPLLGPVPTSPTALFPALLESLPLAMLSYATGDESEMSAYERLFELGEDPTPLSRWIASGVCLSGAPTPPADWSGRAEDTPEDRADALIDNLERVKRHYEELAAADVTKAFTLNAPREWELRRLLPAAVGAVMQVVLDAVSSPPPTEPPPMA